MTNEDTPGGYINSVVSASSIESSWERQFHTTLYGDPKPTSNFGGIVSKVNEL